MHVAYITVKVGTRGQGVGTQNGVSRGGGGGEEIGSIVINGVPCWILKVCST